MINAFVLQNGRINQVPIDSREDLEKVEPVWVDLTDPTDDERAWVRTIYGVILRRMGSAALPYKKPWSVPTIGHFVHEMSECRHSPRC